jgi:hypothetical protein
VAREGAAQVAVRDDVPQFLSGQGGDYIGSVDYNMDEETHNMDKDLDVGPAEVPESFPQRRKEIAKRRGDQNFQN